VNLQAHARLANILATLTKGFNMESAQDYFDQLNDDYLAVHRKKEDLFWSTYMATSNQQAEADQAEKDWNGFISDSNRITEIKSLLSELKTASINADNKALIHGLTGWLTLFESNALESKEAQEQKNKLIDMESELFTAKQAFKLSYIDDKGEKIEAGLPTLGAAVAANQTEVSRKSAYDMFLSVEQWVLDNGFIELVKSRNQFARSQGFKTFFDYSVNKMEQMSTEELFVILDDFEERTRETNAKSVNNLIQSKGESAALPYNFLFTTSGDSTRELDPYVPFSKSLQLWQASFARLNIDYSGADLTLDLLDRDGKYQNGFCHGPVPSYFNKNQWVPAKVNFTSNAKPDQIGSGMNGLATLFHEGGHAAHFANMKQNSPCFSQEFAPTSMAYAETQSMFLDSLLGDADWLKLYAKNEQGEGIPDAIIKKLIEEKQPFACFDERRILVMPNFERALYEMNDEELTAENITKLARDTEQRILGIKCSPRPTLAIPHLLSDESACSYHGYLLANMAVYQTRAFFIKKYGYLCDNPAIGPELAEHYWKPGNSISHDMTIRNLTGEGFNAQYLADSCNASVESAWQSAREKMESALSRIQPEMADLNARIVVVDGPDVLATNDVSIDDMNRLFESAVNDRYGVNQ